VPDGGAGDCGDHILLAPPFTITAEECRMAAQAITAAAEKVFST
jgi:adenosylmethionine-8-amino-7-oxononanoate aminotransferase